MGSMRDVVSTELNGYGPAGGQRTRHRCVTRSWTPDGAGLLGMLPTPTGSVAFITDGSGLVGWGEFAAISVTGADAATQIARWYAEKRSALDVVDHVGVRGSGAVCFVSLGFAPDDASVAVIPEVVLGRQDGATFVTQIGDAPPTDRATVTAPGQVAYADAEMSTTGFVMAVESAVDRIRSGEAAKVVLAHGLTAMTQFAVDERFLLVRLAERYPTCTTFAVGGLIGASPEMLIRRHGTRITSRVLAGTAWPERESDRVDGAVGAGTPGSEPGTVLGAEPGAVAGTTNAPSPGLHRVAADLLASAKDLAEHAFAVRSVADVLGPLASALAVPAHPGALELANLTHLATDISGELTGADPVPSALDLAARLHPTAAVGGTPRAVAQAMIAELEPAPRGRYAAPVGWVDARGDGEFAIALRCAQVSGSTVRLMAGCGIVADSDPEAEAREAQIKMVPVRDALEG